jgi:Domain of unknown function (DUF4333)
VSGRTFAAAAVAAATIAALAGCDTNAKGTYFVDKLRPSLTEKLGEVSSIRCPESILVKNETVFSCDLELASGRSGSIEVTLGKDGELKWKTI